MIDRSFIGHDLGTHEVEIEAGRLRLFNRVIGQTNPVYTDAAAARKAGYPGLPVPPTFYFSLYLEQADPFAYLAMLNVDRSRVVHGEQHFSYHGPAFAGQRLILRSRIADIFARKGGALEFIVTVTAAESLSGSLLSTQKTVLAVRH